jgi:hypothetical protein
LDRKAKEEYQEIRMSNIEQGMRNYVGASYNMSLLRNSQLIKKGGNLEMKKISLFILMALLFCIFAAGCTTTKSSTSYTYSGYLSDYSKLETDKKDRKGKIYIGPAVDFKQYDKILLERIMVYYKEEQEHKAIDPTVLKMLTDYFHAAIVRELGDAYPVVTEPGPGILRTRIAITELVPAQPAMSMVMFAVPYGFAGEMAAGAATQGGEIGGAVYLGDTAMEVEVLDSETNEQLGAYVERRLPKKYNLDTSKGTTAAVSTYSKSYLNAYSEWAYAKAAFDYWAKGFRERLDEARSITAAEDK